MRRRPTSLAPWIGLIAILAMNAALIRAFAFQEMFCGAILILLTLQVGLWCLVQSRGRLRRFWLGLEVSGATSILALFSCELFPNSPLNRLVLAYTHFATNLAFEHLDTALSDHFDDHQNQLLSIIYFMPELVAAILGGLIAARVSPESLRPARARLREESTAVDR